MYFIKENIEDFFLMNLNKQATIFACFQTVRFSSFMLKAEETTTSCDNIYFQLNSTAIPSGFAVLLVTSGRLSLIKEA